jgi:hypothetical protein
MCAVVERRARCGQIVVAFGLLAPAMRLVLFGAWHLRAWIMSASPRGPCPRLFEVM